MVPAWDFERLTSQEEDIGGSSSQEKAGTLEKRN